MSREVPLVHAGRSVLLEPDPAARAGQLIELRSSTGIALMTATVLASAVAALDANVVKIAIPAIGRDLGAGVSALQWTLTSYLLVVAALLLLAGALADRFGRRRVLIAGLCVMLVSSGLCAIAPSVDTLIAARVVQGVGAALVVPTSLALLNGTLRKSDRARAIGVWAGLQTLATTIGPYAGGWLVDQGSWRSVFLLNIPLILGALYPLRHVPENAYAVRSLSLDVRGALLAVLGLAGVVYALTAGPGFGWLSVPVVASAVIGVGSLIALIPIERRVSEPMLRLSLFASEQFNAINISTLLLYGALGTANYLIILQLQLQLGYSAAQAGAALIPQTVVFLAVAPVSGVLVSRFGPRWLMVAGIMMVAVSFALLSFVQPGSSYGEAILPPALLWGLGVGVAVTPLTAAVLAAVGDPDLGEASAINDAASRVGGVVVLGLVPVLIGAVGGQSLGEALATGYQPAMIVMGLLCIAAAFVAAVFVTNDRDAAPSAAVGPPPYHGCVLPEKQRPRV
jgi:EmrB/QacA subfamily drug resistance transporter